MGQITVIPFEVKTECQEQNFSWTGNPSVQKLLDTVVHILANEYVRAVKENPALFKEIASAASRPHNDGGELL
jgi:hypothetical protein